MPFYRRRPLLRMAAVGGVAYMGAKAGTNRAMAAQQQQQQQPDPQAQQAQAAPPPAAAAATDAASDRVSQLKELAELHSSGALTDEEFQKEKQRILG